MLLLRCRFLVNIILEIQVVSESPVYKLRKENLSSPILVNLVEFSLHVQIFLAYPRLNGCSYIRRSELFLGYPIVVSRVNPGKRLEVFKKLSECLKKNPELSKL